MTTPHTTEQSMPPTLSLKTFADDKTLYLIDISSFIFRAFYAIRPLSNSKKMPTNAVYGVSTMLLNMIESQQLKFAACVFDTPKPSFRKDHFDGYKANRTEPPDDLKPQFEAIRRLTEVLGFKGLRAEGYEADDLIGALCKKFSDFKIVVVTGDKDLLQLVNDRVVVWDTMKNLVIDRTGVVNKLGVAPEQVTDYLGLIGDSSDNIPGITGIGPKSAVELLTQFGSLENIFENLDHIKAPKRRALLQESADVAKLSKKLATVEFNAPLENVESFEDLRFEFNPAQQLIRFFKEMEFPSLIKRFETGTTPAAENTMRAVLRASDAALNDTSNDTPNHGADSAPGPAPGPVLDGSTAAINSDRSAYPSPKVIALRTPEELDHTLEQLARQSNVLAFDTETYGDPLLQRKLCGFSFCADESTTYYYPIHQLDIQNDLKSSVAVLQKYIDTFIFIAHNLKFDYQTMLLSGLDWGVNIAGTPLRDRTQKRFFDTVLAHYLIAPEDKHGLDQLALEYLKHPIGDFKETLNGAKNFSEVPLDRAAHYSGLDAWSTFCIYKILHIKLKELNLENLYYTLELPTAIVLAHTELNGVRIDTKILESMSHEFDHELKDLEQEIYTLAGAPFNINSPKQLSVVLFEKLQLPVISKTKTGFSTDISVLEKLAGRHPVPALIVRYRELTKLKNTYIDVLPSLLDIDERVHSSFNQTVAATGRLSSSHPNLQNIPIRSESGRRIRKAFIAAPNYVLVGADYSQIELRLIAELSQDPALVQAFQSGKDVHKQTAAEIFNVTLGDVTEAQRSAAKAINFGLIYGKTAFGLAQELNISRTQAQNYIDAYFRRYQGVQRFLSDCRISAKTTKQTKTLFGRIRPLKDIDTKNPALRAVAERMAMNTPVQGTAADLMKLAMISAFENLERAGLAKIILQVHDELVVECRAEKAEQVATILKDSLTQAASHAGPLSYHFEVPITVSQGTSDNWFNL